jgi:hypothetical protein
MKVKTFLLAALLLAGCAKQTPPQTGAENLKILSPRVQFARPFKLEVTLPRPAVFDPQNYDGENFAVTAVVNDEKNVLKRVLSVYPFAIEETQFPALTFIDENGQEIKTEPFKLKVQKAKTGIKTQGLADIKKPYAPFNKWLILWAALLGCAAYAAYKLAGKFAARRGLAPVAGPRANLPAHEVALGRIETLLRSDLWPSARYKAFYSALTEILRNYLDARFGLDVEFLTTRELLKTLKRAPAFKADLAQVAGLQESADLVKFARQTPTAAQRDADVCRLKDIIEATKETPPPPPQEERQEAK